MSGTVLETTAHQESLVGYSIAIERWAWASIIISLVLSLLNLGIGLASGSLAVISEMVHNLVDLLASIVVLIGLKISQRKNRSFPYGLYKVENVVAVVLSGLIFYTGYEIAREALLGAQKQTTVNIWILVGVLLSIAIPLIFGHFELAAGKSANSPSLIASAMEYRTHIFTSGIVLISLISDTFNLNIDRIASLIIVLFILKTGWELLKDGMRVLLDASLDANSLTQVQRIVESDPAIVQVKSLTGRNSGRYRFLELVISLRTNDLKSAHEVSRRIEKSIKEEVTNVERVLIHYEPIQPTNCLYAFPLANLAGDMSEHFGGASYFALINQRISDLQVEKQEIILNPFTQLPKAKGIRVAEWLISLKVDRVVLKENLQGKGPEYVFKDAGVELIYTAAKSWYTALEELGKRQSLPST
jgi:cation diffusion facilitator family transporter